jgi:hypothetical protein
LQRLSILPQGKVEISPTTQAFVNTIYIDYDKEEPSPYNTSSTPYNRIYQDKDVIVFINGVLTHRTFGSLVEGNDPMLLLQPFSANKLAIKINPKYAGNTIQLDFKSHCEVGHNIADNDVLQTDIIYRHWGTDIVQDDYWTRAKCLDIMASNHKLILLEGNRLSPASEILCDKLFSTFDFTLFPPKAFKTLVESKFFVLNDKMELTDESAGKLRQAFYYGSGLRTAKRLNSFFRFYYPILQNYDFDNVNDLNEWIYPEGLAKSKHEFYTTNNILTDLNTENKSIRDTLINGFRYVLMLSWKSDAFCRERLQKTGFPLDSYRSAPKIFSFPLFMTAQSDVQEWTRANQVKPDVQQYRERLMELLGLPPNSVNDTFVEFWAKEDDLFRPAIDPSLEGSQMFYQINAEYVTALAEYSKNSYSNENFLMQYPFTGCGYTYDWNPSNATHQGLSEFVLKENRTVYVRRKVSTKDYLQGIFLQAKN